MKATQSWCLLKSSVDGVRDIVHKMYPTDRYFLRRLQKTAPSGSIRGTEGWSGKRFAWPRGSRPSASGRSHVTRSRLERLRSTWGRDPKDALVALEGWRSRWGSRYPWLVAAWYEESGALLRFSEYPKALWPYLRGTNLMERFIREVKRATKARDNKLSPT